MKFAKLLFLILLVSIISSQRAAFALSKEEAVKLEADHILSCQYMDNTNPAYGAINNVQGDPTWVVPGENGVAILGLLTATEILGDNTYKTRAQLAANYLLNVQNSDGSWNDQYSFASAVDNAKSTRHTAEVMIALDKLGYSAANYAAMKKAAGYLLSCQAVANKGGNDDGLVGGGKNAVGDFQTWRWASDNSYAYQALEAARKWAQTQGDTAFAQTAKTASEKILNGINNILTSSDKTHWLRVVDMNDQPISGQDNFDWISYAPLMLDVPVGGVSPVSVGDWISAHLQLPDGAVVWDDTYFSLRESPGYSFQASLVWLDSGQLAYEMSAVNWAETSGLWNLANGGWIDWLEGATQAPDWQRFIDTSAYYIMVRNGGYNFAQVVPEPSSLLLFASGIFALAAKSLRKKNRQYVK
jgi:hypothetical protein